jgi:quercetin dioxygenase-like cupin family protein
VSKRYSLATLRDLPAQPCPCGRSRRAFADDPAGAASLHQVTVEADSKVHYHRRHTEIYYVLEGGGEVELDGQTVPAPAGTAVLIKPGCRHRPLGKMTLLVSSVPVFDPADEWMD